MRIVNYKPYWSVPQSLLTVRWFHTIFWIRKSLIIQLTYDKSYEHWMSK